MRTAILAAGLLAIAAGAFATPIPNGAVIKTRIFNDCPGSVLTTTNMYPALISIDDTNMGCVGFANLHNWRFSEDGGATAAVFNNGDAFRFCASLVISGTGQAEAGLQVSPWWSQDVDGRLNVRTTDGEVACFGGRLPFYSFTGQHGVVYVKGTPIYLEITYRPNGLSMASPATIEYKVIYNSMTYLSGPLNFDMGNPNDPPHGLWGMLDDARVGGHHQFFVGQSGPAGNATATWREICYEPLDVVGVEEKSWSAVKHLYE